MSGVVTIPRDQECAAPHPSSASQAGQATHVFFDMRPEMQLRPVTADSFRDIHAGTTAHAAGSCLLSTPEYV